MIWPHTVGHITISSVFHLHNSSATHKLSIYLDGQHLRHLCHPTYLRVTLEHTLSYGEHLTKTTGKLKNRNNLARQLFQSILNKNSCLNIICCLKRDLTMSLVNCVTHPFLNCHMCILLVLRYLSLIMPLIIIYDFI